MTTTFTAYTRTESRTFDSLNAAYNWALSTGSEAECRDEEFNHVFTTGDR